MEEGGRLRLSLKEGAFTSVSKAMETEEGRSRVSSSRIRQPYKEGERERERKKKKRETSQIKRIKKYSSFFSFSSNSPGYFGTAR